MENKILCKDTLTLIFNIVMENNIKNLIKCRQVCKFWCNNIDKNIFFNNFINVIKEIISDNDDINFKNLLDIKIINQPIVKNYFKIPDLSNEFLDIIKQTKLKNEEEYSIIDNFCICHMPDGINKLKETKLYRFWYKIHWLRLVWYKTH